MTRSALVLALALTACAAHPSTAPRAVPADGTAVALPPLPDSMPSLLGNLAVIRLDNLRNTQGQPLLGGFVPETRTVYVKASIPNPITAWQTYFHESCHVTLWDSGLRNAFSAPGGEQLQDSICDAMALSRVREMQQQQRAK